MHLVFNAQNHILDFFFKYGFVVILFSMTSWFSLRTYKTKDRQFTFWLLNVLYLSQSVAVEIETTQEPWQYDKQLRHQDV